MAIEIDEPDLIAKIYRLAALLDVSTDEAILIAVKNQLDEDILEDDQSLREKDP